MKYLLLALVAIAGAGIPIQVAANKRMDEAVHSPALATTLAFVVGAAVMAVFSLTGVLGRGSLSGVNSAPWWAWLGGALSVTVVLVSVIALPKAGAECTIAATVVGQLIAAAVIDHFGWLGVERQPLNISRIVATILLVAGAFLLQRK